MRGKAVAWNCDSLFGMYTSTAAAVEAFSASYAASCGQLLRAVGGPAGTLSGYMQQAGNAVWGGIPQEQQVLIVQGFAAAQTRTAEIAQLIWPYIISALMVIGKAISAVHAAVQPILLNFKQQGQLLWWWLEQRVWPRLAKRVFDLMKWLHPRVVQLWSDASAAAITVAHNGPTQALELYSRASTGLDQFLADKVPAVHAQLAAANAAATPYVKRAKSAAAPYINQASITIKEFYLPGGELSTDRIIYSAAVVIFVLTAMAFIRSRTAMQNASSSHQANMEQLLKPPSQQGKSKKNKKSKKSKKAQPSAAPAAAAASAAGGSSSGSGSKKAPKKKINMAEVMKKAKAAQKEADKLPEHDSLLRGVKGHSKGNAIMTCFAMSPDQRFLATGGTDSKVRVTVLAGWEDGAVSKTHSWELEYTYPVALAWAPNAHHLLVTDAKKQIHVYTVHKDAYKAPELRKTHPLAQKAEATLLAAAALPGNSSSLFAVTASTNNKDTAFHMLSMASGEKLASSDTGQMQHYDVAVSPSAAWLSFASWTPEAKLWHIDSKGGGIKGVHKAMVLGGHHGGVRGVHFSADSKCVHTVGMDGEVREWDLDVAWQRGADAKKVGSVAVPRQGKVLRTAMRSDGSLLAVLMQVGAAVAVKEGTASAAGGGAHGRLIFMDPRSGQEVPLLGGDMDLLQCFGGAGVEHFAFSPCGTLLLTLGKNAHRLLIWQVPETGDSDSE